MSDMKCPVCDKPMKQATYDCDKKDNDDTLYMSIMPCDCVCNFAASKAVWEELADTKKQLEIAVDALKIARDCCSDYSIECLAGETLDKITALEQKDK